MYICEIEKGRDWKLTDQQSPSLQTVQHFQPTLWPKEPLLDLILLVKVQTKVGPTSSSNRDFPNQGLYGQRLDLDRDRESAGWWNTPWMRSRRSQTVLRDSLQSHQMHPDASSKTRNSVRTCGCYGRHSRGLWGNNMGGTHFLPAMEVLFKLRLKWCARPMTSNCFSTHCNTLSSKLNPDAPPFIPNPNPIHNKNDTASIGSTRGKSRRHGQHHNGQQRSILTWRRIK